jgi:hypothetical protein
MKKALSLQSQQQLLSFFPLLLSCLKVRTTSIINLKAFGMANPFLVAKDGVA